MESVVYFNETCWPRESGWVGFWNKARLKLAGHAAIGLAASQVFTVSRRHLQGARPRPAGCLLVAFFWHCSVVTALASNNQMVKEKPRLKYVAPDPQCSFWLYTKTTVFKCGGLVLRLAADLSFIGESEHGIRLLLVVVTAAYSSHHLLCLYTQPSAKPLSRII